MLDLVGHGAAFPMPRRDRCSRGPTLLRRLVRQLAETILKTTVEYHHLLERLYRQPYPTRAVDGARSRSPAFFAVPLVGSSPRQKWDWMANYFNTTLRRHAMNVALI
jgi:hypothetical protein